jgi:hypothetical protein
MMLERGDFDVLHEPFSYLAEFGHSDVGGVRARTEAELIAAIRAGAGRRPVFFKDTTDERYGDVLDDPEFLGRDVVHAFLVRHPALTIPSYRRINPDVTVDQIGFGHLHELFHAVAAAGGGPPPVIDAEDLVADPEGIVGAFCAAVGIDLRPDSLRWERGVRAEWSPSARWHLDVARSNGFHAASHTARTGSGDPTHARYLAHHLPYFTDLYARRLVVPCQRA